ncbi:uncharacterized protein LOC113027357 [Astatotilapia calliptera]|uniref:uncharacterized protein LOC113027357 n=1 Tax=Astatotilapia calliptera TaxID=8154 RepID=UPI000E3FE1C6|nr:uncharacterized protein LOC113027357 [Astatotilapia calliptera]
MRNLCKACNISSGVAELIMGSRPRRKKHLCLISVVFKTGSNGCSSLDRCENCIPWTVFLVCEWIRVWIVWRETSVFPWIFPGALPPSPFVHSTAPYLSLYTHWTLFCNKFSCVHHPRSPAHESTLYVVTVALDAPFDYTVEPAVVEDLPPAVQQVVQNKALFCGHVTMPKYLSLNKEDQQRVKRHVGGRRHWNKGLLPLCFSVCRGHGALFKSMC